MARRTILFITLLLPAVLLPVGATSVFAPQDSTDRSVRPAVALVLGGGGAKGAAHVGALKAIEEAGIQPDIIVGTSIGAIVGGLYSIGYSAADLDTLFRSQRWLQLFTREAIRGNAIRSMLDSLVVVGKCREKERSVAFACIAADLPTLSEVVLDGDSMARNMRASMSIPGLFRPLKFGGRVLIDGGMLNNLPVDVARQMGAGVVIAVDLTQNHHDADGAAAAEKSDFGLSDLFDVTRVKGLLGWLLNRPDFVKHSENKRAVDIYINPPLEVYSATSFARQSIEEMIAIGEQAARKKLLLGQQQPRDTVAP